MERGSSATPIARRVNSSVYAGVSFVSLSFCPLV
jgi:hypothetical protein